MSTTVLIDYGSGNLRSAAKAFERAAAEAGVATEVTVTDDPEAVCRADRVVLPGVGAFADCMAGLQAIDGLLAGLAEAVETRGRPFLGICVGMQLMARVGREHGDHHGLGWIDGEVVAIDPAGGLPVPHMGWQDLILADGSHPLLSGIRSGDHAYFVHSYHMRPTDPADLAATVDYGGAVTAAVARGNRFGTQFHPEKSQATGLRLIANFLTWAP